MPIPIIVATPLPRTDKRVALYCYLARILWQLSCRIAWKQLAGADNLRVEAVLPMLERAVTKARVSQRPRVS